MDDKKVVPVEKMVGKIEAAVAAKENKEFFILARTDALAPEGLVRLLVARVSSGLNVRAVLWLLGSVSLTSLPAAS